MVVVETNSPGGHGKGRKSNDASEISDTLDVSLNLGVKWRRQLSDLSRPGVDL